MKLDTILSCLGLILCGIISLILATKFDDHPDMTVIKADLSTIKNATIAPSTANSTTPKDVKYRHSLNKNLQMFSDKTFENLRDLCYSRYNIYEIELETYKNLNCSGHEIKAFITEIVNQIILCFPKKNHPNQTEVNNAIDEAHKRYCIVHKMMEFKENNICFNQTLYEGCINTNTIDIFWRKNILKFILLVTEGETYPFNKEVEDNLHCSRLKLSTDCFKETANNCSAEIKVEADQLATEYWSGMSCVKK